MITTTLELIEPGTPMVKHPDILPVLLNGLHTLIKKAATAE